MYTILGKVAEKIGNVYKKSEDDTLEKFIQAYNTMQKEVKFHITGSTYIACVIFGCC